jgi:hypothetical protein
VQLGPGITVNCCGAARTGATGSEIAAGIEGVDALASIAAVFL